MQIGGIRSDNNTHVHHVSRSIQGDAAEQKIKSGGMPTIESAMQQTAGQAADEGTAAFSLTDFFSRLHSGIKSRLGRIWGEGSEDDTAKAVEEAAAGEKDNVALESTINSNPYFTPVIAAESAPNIIQRLKLRVHQATGYLAKRFSFSGRNAFDAKNGEKRENLRRKSHYRDNDTEIECTITDDSYLMDSYDRKGEYSRLSTRL
ncbi:MAG: hypothetical protein LUG83_07330 [Lachnospiraceae bacterium]|nr:hypothetical protein [Lachnospiraceae bacterium]